ncbi:hypothetical protein pdam_00015794 [Pocillopora damicornis]|uniref:Thioredoxin domain-containing protein n=1 Tax=Pocillopora damicornis TaxID=46731 RepID=A0A3M6UC59_POCDA|nr:hypothetical protein pdam_00015794 [Pocillopora damicornis]
MAIKNRPSIQFRRIFSLTFLALVVLFCRCNAFVKELDDSFSSLMNEGSWLVEFYAPWCGYCKKLEPIWAEVGKTLYGSPIRVGKLDATRYSALAKHFGIRGFPSIKFIKGKRVLTFEGERTVQDFVQFAEKANRPAVTELKDAAQMERIRNEKSVCFFLVTSNDNAQLSEKLKHIFYQVAEDKVIQSYFYQIDQGALPEDVEVKGPTVIVSKDGSISMLEGSDDVIEESTLSGWVNNERFEAFVHVTRSNFHDITTTGKIMLLTVLAEQKSKKKINERVSKIVKIWMDVGGYYCNKPHDEYSEIKEEFTEQQLVSFLEDVLEGRAKGYGGDSYFQRFYRGIWELLRSIYEIWTTQPIAAILMFGFPLLVFSFLIYMLCIADPGPEEEDLEELQEEGTEYLDDEDGERELKATEEVDANPKPKTE